MRGLAAGALAFALALAGCPAEGGGGAAVVSLLDLTGVVPAPETGEAPDTAIDAAQYTGTVAWQNAGGPAFGGSAFAASTVYEALVTLTAKDGFTFAGVAAGSFTHSGAASVTSAADSGAVTITFPATAAVVSLLDLTGAVPAPETDAVPDTAAIDTDEYAGTAAWKTADGAAFGGSVFAPGTVYEALVTLTAKDGYTFAGVADGSFTHSGAKSVTNAADSGTVTITFPATSGITVANLASYLAGLPDNTADSPHTVPLAAETNISGGGWADINSAVQSAGRFVILDLSACSAERDTVTGHSSPSGGDFNIIKDNGYITGVILPDTLTSIGASAFWGCAALTSVTIPDSVTSIGFQAFQGCSSLASVIIPAAVTSIGMASFHETGLTSVTFEGSGAGIQGSTAFPSCASLQSAYHAGGAGAYTLSGGVWTKR
ncbi:MAG: leucine-rich repeat domain-containing protein [Treponematales bacterium]